MSNKVNCTSGDSNEQGSPFGYGSSIDNGWHLMLAFGVVALYMTLCGYSLNQLESLTNGTSYQLMLQRIYREIMMVGLAAFMYTILNATDTNISDATARAFGFADICSFIMAFFFCLQGVLIMIGSVRQTHIWDAVADMTFEELQYSLSSFLATRNRLLLNPYYPLGDVRDQAEFKIFNSLFSSTYNISTKNHEFDFGMFLRKSHEDNILSIIEIGPEKWLLILLITVLPALKIQFYRTECATLECQVEEEIYMCMVVGFVNTLLAIFVFVRGRHSELLLLQKAGVFCTSDYSVFLAVEGRTRHALSKSKVASTMVKDAISEYLVESESIAASKRAARRSNIRRQSVVAKAKVLKVIANTSARVGPLADSSSTRTHDDDNEEPNSAIRQQGALNALSDLDGDMMVENMEEGDVADNVSSSPGGRGAIVSVVQDSVDEKAKACRSHPLRQSGEIGKKVKKVIVRRTSTAGDGYVVQTTDTQIVDADQPTPPPPAPPAKEKLKRRRSEMMRGGGLRKSVMRMSFVSSTKASYKEKIRSSYEKENFSDVFLLGSSTLYYGLMSVVITANSLYLAWWITDFLMVILRLKNMRESSVLMVLSALPPLATFPFLYFAIRSSTILKALSSLKLDVVSAVVERTEGNSHLKKNFRELCLATVKDKGNPRPELRNLFETHSADGISLSWDEFQELVIASKIHLTQQKLRYLYSVIRPTPTRDVNYSTFERFILQEANGNAEEGERENSMSEAAFASLLNTDEKRVAAGRILEFLDPNAISQISIP